MASKHEESAKRQTAAEQARRAWVAQRIENIHQHVTAYDVLARNNVVLRYGDDREEQFSCPFHGRDRRPSARVYPVSARSPSHAWCFVCQERWDAITLWSKFNQFDDKPFTVVLSDIERAFQIPVPEMSADAHLVEDTSGVALEEFDALYEVAERRLKNAAPAFKYLDDLTGFLKAGSVLDKLRYRVDECVVKPSRGEQVLRQLLERIAAKERQCPEG